MKKQIKEYKFRHPVHFAGHTVRLVENVGKFYLVAHYLPAGEDLIPHAYRYDNLQAANDMIEQIEANLIGKGYEVIARYYF